MHKPNCRRPSLARPCRGGRAWLRLAALSLACCGLSAAADEAVAVFGSYANPSFAESHLERLQAGLGVELRIVPHDAAGDRLHRMVSEPMSIASARQLIARGARSGHDAWLLRLCADAEDGNCLAAEGAAGAFSATAAVDLDAASDPAYAAALRAAQAAAEAAAGAPSEPAPESAAGATRATEAPSAPAPEPVPAAPPPPRETAAAPPAADAATGYATIVAPHIESPGIVVDGRVDEAVWREVQSYDNMRVMEPETLAEPTYATTTRFIYTSRGLYVSAVMEQPPETLVARLSSRDQFINRDSFGVTLDTSGEGLYGYWFNVGLGGSLGDGKVAPERSFSRQWDGPWHGASAALDDGWSIEMYLPWSMMTMPQSQASRTVGFWVNRKVAHMDERYSWPVLPFTAPRFMSALQPLEVADVSPARQWAVYPYASATADAIHDEQDAKVGVDVLWRPSTNLQVNAALNPDFGAVESDDVVVNLTATETFFPEKRLFFLEGQEVFDTSPRANPRSSSSGPQGQGARRSPSTFFREPTTMLNTRRIGGAARHVSVPDGVDVPGVERSKPTDLIGATKVVGQFGGMRYGLLGAFEDEVELFGENDGSLIEADPDVRVQCDENAAEGAARDCVLRADGRQFGAARVLYEQSSGGSRRGIGYMGTMVDKGYETAVVHGIDTHWLGFGGSVEWDTQLLASEVGDEQGYGVFMDLNYAPRTGVMHRFALEYLDDDLNVRDFGFIRRTDAVSALWGVFRTYTHNLPSQLRNVRASMFASYEENTDGLATRIGAFGGVGFTFQDNSQVRLMLNYFPRRWDDLNSRGNGAYRVEERVFAQAQFGTDSSRPFSFSAAVGVDGEEFGGSSFLFDTGFTFTPVHRFSVDFDLRYKDRDGWLVYRGHQDGRGDRDFTTYKADDLQPRVAIDLFLSARQQLRMTAQWAGIKATEQRLLEVPEGGGSLVSSAADVPNDDFAISRLTTQLRYRWEIGPLSDLFVVYTRGGNPEGLEDMGFNDLFLEALDEPIVDLFVIKLRYRVGS